MKKLINGKVYDTQTAELRSEWDNGYFANDSSYCSEDLYRKRTGEYFLHVQGGERSKYASYPKNSSGLGEAIIPLDTEEAERWAEKRLAGDEYEKIFGAVEEPDITTRINWTLDTDIVEDLRQRTADTGIPVSRAVSDVLRAAGYGKK